jgi:hypothetical protein
VGHQAIIYGRIQGCREFSQGLPTEVYEYNAAIVRSLPDRDEEWPFLTRHMFAFAERSPEGGNDRGLYKSQVIHFGVSFKDDPNPVGRSEVWEAWLGKFEELLLKNLAWVSAKVHIESDFDSERVYVYRVDREAHGALLAHLGNTTLYEARWQRSQFDLRDWKQDWLL